MTTQTGPEAIRARNRTALATAQADPLTTVERLAALPWLANVLTAWPDPWADGADIPPTVDGPKGAIVHPAYRAAEARGHLAVVRFAGGWDGLEDPEGLRTAAAGWAIDKLHGLPEAPEATTGLSLLSTAIDKLPPTVRPEARPDPLLPVVQAVREAPEREAGRLAFGGILDAGDPPPGQLAMFPAPEGPRVALLELTDAHGVPTMTQGRAARKRRDELRALADKRGGRARAEGRQVSARTLCARCGVPTGKRWAAGGAGWLRLPCWRRWTGK